MQTDMGGEIDLKTVTASYLYAARYGYSDIVLNSDNRMKLFPREGEGQTPIRANLWTLPDGRGVDYADRFGNRVHRARVVETHTALVIATAGQVSLSTESPAPRDVDLDAAAALPEGIEYVMPSPLVDPDSVSALALRVASGSDSLLRVARAVIGWVYEEVEYLRGADGRCDDGGAGGGGDGRRVPRQDAPRARNAALAGPAVPLRQRLADRTDRRNALVAGVSAPGSGLGRRGPDAGRHSAAGARLREAVRRTRLYGRVARQWIFHLARRGDRRRSHRVGALRGKRTRTWTTR